MGLFSELEAQMTVNASDFSTGLSSAASDAQSFARDTASSFSIVGSSAEEMDDDVSGAQSGFNQLAEKMRDTIIPAQLLEGRLNDVGSEASKAGRKAASASKGFVALSISSSGLSFTLGVLSTVTSSTVLALGALLGVLTLVGAALAPLVIGAAAVAAAFGVIVGSGIVAWGEGFQQALKKAQKEIMPMVKTLGKQFVPLLKDAVNALPGLVKNIINAIGPLDQFKSALRTFGSIAARVLPKLVSWFFEIGRYALPIIEKLVKFFLKNLVPALKSITQFGKRVIKRVRELVTWFRNTTKQGSKVRKKFNQLKSSLQTFWKRLQPVLKALGPFFNQLKKLAPVIAGLVLDIASLAVTIGTKLLPYVKTIVKWATKLLKWFNSLSPTIKRVVLTIGGLVAILGPLYSIGMTVYAAISSIAATALSLWGAFTTLVSVVTTVISIAGSLIAALNPITLLILGIIAVVVALWVAFNGNFGKIQSIVMTTLDKIISFVMTWGGKILNWFKNSFIPGVIGFLTDLWKQGEKTLKHGLGVLLAYLTGQRGPLASVYSAGQSLIDEFINGISSKVGAIKNAVSNAVSKARDQLPFSPANEGPLSDLDKTGPAFVDTFASGIENNSGRVQKAVNKTMAVAQPQANKPQPSTGRRQSRGKREVVVQIQTDDEALRKWVDNRADVVVKDNVEDVIRQGKRRGEIRE